MVGGCFLACLCVWCGRRKLQSIPLSHSGGHGGEGPGQQRPTRVPRQGACAAHGRVCGWRVAATSHITPAHTQTGCDALPFFRRTHPGMHNLPVGRVTAWHVSFWAVSLASNSRRTARPTCEVCCASRLRALDVCVCVLVAGLLIAARRGRRLWCPALAWRLGGACQRLRTHKSAVLSLGEWLVLSLAATPGVHDVSCELWVLLLGAFFPWSVHV